MYSVILEVIEGTRQLTIIAAAVVCVFDFQPVEYPSPAETENLEGRRGACQPAHSVTILHAAIAHPLGGAGYLAAVAAFIFRINPCGRAEGDEKQLHCC